MGYSPPPRPPLKPPFSITPLPPKRSDSQPTRTCPYCGQPAQPDWLVCGQGQTWGCGAALVPDEEVSVRAHLTTAEAGEAIDVSVNTKRPGISAAEFEAQFRLTPEYQNSYAGKFEQLDIALDIAAEDLKKSIGEAFLSLTRRLVGVFI